MSEEYLLRDMIRKIARLESDVDHLRQELITHQHQRDSSWDIWLRYVDRMGRSSYTDHFRSGSQPTTLTWYSDGTFNAAPTTVNYSTKGTYLEAYTTNTPHFLAFGPIGTYDDRQFFARLCTGLTTEIGIRIDDGTDTNYAEMILDPQGDGTYIVDFRHRTGGGVTDTPGPQYPCSEFVVVNLLWYSSTPAVYGYIRNEAGRGLNVTSFNTAALAWTPERVGIKVQVDSGNAAFCDWFYNNFA